MNQAYYCNLTLIVAFIDAFVCHILNATIATADATDDDTAAATLITTAAFALVLNTAIANFHVYC